MIRVLTLLSLLLPLVATAADTAQPVEEDPVLEKRVMALTAELRCLVCQNQSLADSHADLAIDLKNQVRAMMKEGRSDAEIKAFMTDRYGDFVLYRPPVKATTWLLWIGPFVLFAVGLAALFAYIRRRRTAAGEATSLTPEQQARARALLEGGDRSNG
jgi:cytochrome c-type biogenesis protein CcmH